MSSQVKNTDPFCCDIVNSLSKSTISLSSISKFLAASMTLLRKSTNDWFDIDSFMVYLYQAITSCPFCLLTSPLLPVGLSAIFCCSIRPRSHSPMTWLAYQEEYEANSRLAYPLRQCARRLHHESKPPSFSPTKQGAPKQTKHSF